MGRPTTHKVQMPGAPMAAAAAVGAQHGGEQPSFVVDEIDLAGLGTDDASIEVAGRQILLNDIVRGAYESSGMSVEEWNALPGDARDNLIGNQQREIIEAGQRAASMPSQAEEQARAQAAVVARRAAHAPRAGHASREPALPHPNEFEGKEVHAPILTSEGWIAPNVQRPLPTNYR